MCSNEVPSVEDILFDKVATSIYGTRARVVDGRSWPEAEKKGRIGLSPGTWRKANVWKQGQSKRNGNQLRWFK